MAAMYGKRTRECAGIAHGTGHERPESCESGLRAWESGAASIKDMGKVMAVLKERYAGQMDFSRASAATKDALSGK